MKKENQFPTRKDLDEAFHFLHDQINRISVEEEKEMVISEKEVQEL
ncbi:hypothetical protein NDK43_00590 [Neobacillus pocheonensis]|uniref:Uncharacterized protein n=1 Tax=Neobacillus pocheonensis TaxID=363869 RepID=A0ABT0W4D8_9BACI|nr:hypothetical protein [Neobacillus pocheonensis]